MSFFQRLGTAKRAASGVESLQLINGEGMFDGTGLEAFAKTISLAACGLSYAVVAIMGPQSSGKSTLLNHLFCTSFVEMDAFAGRNQTTQGVWLARATGVDPCTIVMDLEGTDGRERGEDDTAFEKQSALFALAVADVVLINMWCHDIGREQAANKPLLKIVFQVMVRLFTPRKTTLLFVIRDKTRTPMEVLEPILREDVQKIWESTPKPSSFEGMELTDCFNVQVTALSNYEDKPEVFKDQVADLRERFNNSVAPGGLAGDRSAVIPGTAFPVSIRSIWDTIKENRDLDLPAHKVMVATVRCEEIANEKLSELLQNQEWMEISEKAKSGAVPGFGGKVNFLLNKIISEYDQEVSYFDENVRISKCNYLIQKSLETFYPAHQQILSHHRLGAMNKFRQNMRDWSDSSSDAVGFAAATRQTSETALSDFDNGVADAKISFAEWDSLKLRDKLRRDIDAHAARVENEKIGALVADAEKRLQQNVGEPTGALLETATPDTWHAVRDLVGHEVKLCQSALLSLLAGYELDTSSEGVVLDNLAGYGRTVVEKEARREAGQALLRMKDRFTTSFSHDAESLPRLWSDKDDVRAIARDARILSLKGLSVLAAIRLDDDKADRVEPALVTLLADQHEGSQPKAGVTSVGENSAITPANSLATSSWEGVSTEYTLLTPTQCKGIWRQFKAETDFAISQALAAQEARRNSKSWLPPPWAIGAMIVLGFNEFIALLRNPLYLLIFFIAYLLGRALWVQLNLSQEFRHGILPGILSVLNKIVPTIVNLMTKLAEEGSAAAHPKASSSGSTTSVPLNRSRSSMGSMGTLDSADMLDFATQEHLNYGHVIDSDNSFGNRQRTKSGT